MKQQWLIWANKLQAIAHNGLNYCDNPHAIERYQAIQNIAAEIIENHSDLEHKDILQIFAKEDHHLTPKIDVRGAVFRDNRILLVKENCDGLWSLPGGWADVSESPSESVAREIFEESGFKTKVTKLVALYDEYKHAHPPQLPHAYKCFFLCEMIAGEPTPSFETAAVDFFSENNLPELS
jgi:ADP-ribose pyrophosphatase YjhB (NUDIX family)